MATLREVEYDSFSGVTKKWYFDGDKIVCEKSYDETELVQHAAQCRSYTAGSSFINDSRMMHRMAVLPPIVIEKIMKDHGLNLLGDLTPSEQIKFRKIIELEYPWCKTHEKKLWRAASNTLAGKK